MAPPHVVAAQPGSLKHEAIEAELRVRQCCKHQVINLGSDIPFIRILQLVEDSFYVLLNTFAKGNLKILKHYHVARNCLEECLSNLLYNMLLMLIIIIGTSLVTLFIATGGKGFKVSQQKDPKQFTANLATRMLWFLRPKAFLWEVDNRIVLQITEIIKKIKYKGVNNCFL